MTEELNRRIDEIRNDLKSLDNKLDHRETQAAEDRVDLRHVKERLETISKVLLSGNGKPPVTSQVYTLEQNIDNFEKRMQEQTNTLNEIHQQVRNLSGSITTIAESQVKAQEAKWKTYGKVAALIALVLPGIASFFDSVLPSLELNF